MLFNMAALAEKSMENEREKKPASFSQIESVYIKMTFCCASVFSASVYQ